MVGTVEWTREGEVFAPGSCGDADSVRASRPWVLEEPDGTLRMWYSGHDGTTGRIVEAIQPPGGQWQRVGVAVHPGLCGDSDGFGVESPCVVRVPGGYLMAYGGSDGEHTRVHMAISPDGHRWVAHGTIMQRGVEDSLAATHPCLLITGRRWWLFYSGYDGANEGRHGGVLAAVSTTGASWDRLGPVLEPSGEELGASHPCVLDVCRKLYMFYASDDGEHVGIALATSEDGSGWQRRGVVLNPAAQGHRDLAVHTPCAVRLRNGSLRLWYAERPAGDTELAYRICAATFPGAWPA
ncbi:MAG: hypothetical protein NVSMB32_10560 [Actinomycetota bacterium]